MSYESPYRPDFCCCYQSHCPLRIHCPQCGLRYMHWPTKERFIRRVVQIGLLVAWIAFCFAIAG